MKPGDYDEYGDPVWQSDHAGQSGSAHYVSAEQRGWDAVKALREVVAEVTNGRIPVPERRGPRF